MTAATQTVRRPAWIETRTRPLRFFVVEMPDGTERRFAPAEILEQPWLRDMDGAEYVIATCERWLHRKVTP